MKRARGWFSIVTFLMALLLPGGTTNATEQRTSGSATERTWQDLLAAAARPALPRDAVISINAADGGPWTDTVGCPNFCDSNMGTRDGVGNVYLIASGRTLTEIESYLNVLISTKLRYVVFESSAKDGLYAKIFEREVSPSGTGKTWYSSGSISVVLEVGKYYWIGVSWENLVVYYFGGSPPNAVSFGTQVSGGHFTFPIGETERGAGGSLSYRQRLTTTGGCSAPPEPGHPSPIPGAMNVAIDTPLSWVLSAPCDRFRLLASTSGIRGGLNPYSLIELGLSPAKEVDLGPIGYLPHLDFSPQGVLYGADNGSLKTIDPATGLTQSVCGSLRTREGRGLSSVRGLAFHPNGTLYVVDAGSDGERVFYTIDLPTCLATEVCRIPFSKAPIWGIGFSPDGVLYGAFGDLMKIDLTACQATRVGPSLSWGAWLTDIDWAPDGFLYGVDNETRALYKIDPATGLVATAYGPYSSETWGVASQCVAATSTAGSAGASVQALAEAPVLPGSDELISAFADGLAFDAERRQVLELLAVPGAGEVSADMSAGDRAEPSLHAAGQPDPTGLTCDVYLDTVNPPARLACRDVAPPTKGEVWTCDPGVLGPGTTYYWQVVAKNCGGKTAGRIWSFRTEGHVSSTTDAPK